MATLAAEDRAPLERLQRTWETPRGWRGTLSTVDHKTIGKRYLVTAFVFLARRRHRGARHARPARPRPASRSRPGAYNELFSMHGVTMIFLYAAPILSRLQQLSLAADARLARHGVPAAQRASLLDLSVAGHLHLHELLLGQMPNAGWFAYVPYARARTTRGSNIDFYASGCCSSASRRRWARSTSSSRSSRCARPGMSLNRLPIIVWGTLTTSFVDPLRVPSLTAALIFL